MKIEIDGATFHVTKSANENPRSKTALVFLHYYGGSSREWAPVIELLGNDFRCFAPDLRGFGESDDAPKNYTVEDAADDVTALIEKLDLEKYALIGHSMGGKIALEIAARQPRNLQSLILFAPSPPTPEPMDDAERARLASTRGSRDAAENTLGKITAHRLPPAFYEIALEDNLKSAPGAWQAWLDVGSREDISARMKNIQVPVTVVAGECDGAMTPKLLQRELVSRLSAATLTTIPDAAHLLPLEAPGRVAEIIAQNAAWNGRAIM